MLIEQADRDLYFKQLGEARNIVAGPAIPFDLLTPENFPILNKYSPEQLTALWAIGEIGFQNDLSKINFFREHPEIANWPNEQERAFLVSAYSLGFGEKALESLKTQYANMMKNNTIGFGTMK
jgi:hypothetical protein